MSDDRGVLLIVTALQSVDWVPGKVAKTMCGDNVPCGVLASDFARRVD